MFENKLDKNFVLGCGVTLAGMGLVGYACHITKSAKPLWGLLLIPTYKLSSVSSKKPEAKTAVEDVVESVDEVINE